MNRLQSGGFSSSSTRYTVDICFDQPYYFSSERIRCRLKIQYERNPKNLEERLEDFDLLNYVTIQLFGYTTLSGELQEILNSDSSSSSGAINNFFSNILGMNGRLDFFGRGGREPGQRNKLIFVSNPFILTSNVKILKPKGEIGTFFYSCFLPPFIPPTFSGRFVSFSYIALVSIGLNNKTKVEKHGRPFGLDSFANFGYSSGQREGDGANSSEGPFPVVQKKLKFDIKCLGPHPRSSALFFSSIRRSGLYHPITAISRSVQKDVQIDDFSSIFTCSSDKIPSVSDTLVLTNCPCEFSEKEILSFSESSPGLILQRVLGEFNRKIFHIKNFRTRGETSLPKMRFFELEDHLDVYSHLNGSPRSLFETYWEYEISAIRLPTMLSSTLQRNSSPRKSPDSSENLTINFKNGLVASCKILNIGSWSASLPIVLNFSFLNSFWKTQEIHITIKRVEVIKKEERSNSKPTTESLESSYLQAVYSYKKCTLWDLEFSHQIKPLSSILVPSFRAGVVNTHYQLSIDFFIYGTEKSLKRINFLDVNRFPNLIKLSWSSGPINFLGKLDKPNIEPRGKVNDTKSLCFFPPVSSILPNSNVLSSKSVDF
ncbi:Reduced growth phenotype protein 1 [Cryptosporidium felis]|nr:Reduced growth phenotype protein 1 [Cryptosporidium felis]